MLQNHTGHGMQALLLPRKQQKRGGILCRKSGCWQMLPLGMEAEVALPYLFRFAPFFNAPAASYLGHRNISFFDCIAGSKNKSFLLILTIATNLTFGLLLARPAVREGESAKEKAMAHRSLPSIHSRSGSSALTSWRRRYEGEVRAAGKFGGSSEFFFHCVLAVCAPN